ncbi:NitT/TauT family transport system permease protein [Aneurinibacillus soli]|uniref:Bicarbonate transport system permease protein CmpB n=1 Tax=Aneurinibacillus soli TaxID=1500254 RepID=A0A0U4WIL0_9BACL|nr:ABC transporter permease subunit [Aneurinibacillus soli]PYE61699.1 NitT/TauT family transport system permease protein [Aneurinibacillus soli]BAU28443.1 Bicarbonate transport system permease protein CmpB [Aneurinibacillus soli]
MKINLFSSLEENKKFGWADLLVITAIFSVLFSVLKLGAGMRVPFSTIQHPKINLDPSYLPYYAGRSLLRMFIAFAASLLFTFIYGRIAAFNRTAEKIMIPAIDILQSVPVLGFLSVTVIGFMSLFPGSLLGVECASIFAIFTGQVWNMTFSFYHSLSTIPHDLQEAAKINKLGSWARFTKLEVPYSMIGLVWNSMMSFGGGWFFLAASESITVLNQDIHLPGIGSYMATAVDQGNILAIFYAILTMIIMILVVDQLFWRPLVAWSQKFKNEQTEANDITTSWLYNIIRRARFLQYIMRTCKSYIHNWIVRITAKTKKVKRQQKQLSKLTPMIKWLIGIVVGIFIAKYVYEGILEISKLSVSELLKIIWFGLLTAGRVFVATLLGILWTLPVGVMIGFHPKLARIAQPIVQILASFPANMTFPFLTILYIKYGINMEIGAIPLMMLGTQWYILFNVIAGAMAIPSDLREASKILRLTQLQTWKRLILPGVFPYVITGGITASGGAWNASIVSEMVSWKDHTLQATGLGSFITQATTNGNWPQIIWGIMVMAVLVVVINRLFWRKLYTLAEKKYHIG